jgi:hypothetical protein
VAVERAVERARRRRESRGGEPADVQIAPGVDGQVVDLVLARRAEVRGVDDPAAAGVELRDVAVLEALMGLDPADPRQVGRLCSARRIEASVGSASELAAFR